MNDFDARRSPSAISFRDPGGSVHLDSGTVTRRLTVLGLQRWRAFRESGCALGLMRRGLLIDTTAGRDDFELVHERIPFTSYASEWPFTLLQRAALLHLELLLELHSAGFTLQDADPSNVQFWGGRPVFIDVTSIVGSIGPAWPAMGHFCDTMLYPLLLESEIGVDWRPWLRSRPAGIDCGEMARLLGPRRFLSRLALVHVVLRGILEKQTTGMTARDSESLSKEVGGKAGFRHMITRLHKAISELRPAASASTVWHDYDRNCHYEAAVTEAKLKTVSEVAATVSADGVVMDFGANRGRFSQAVAATGRNVVAIDSAADVVDQLARETSVSARGAILPLVMDLSNPTPKQGWAGLQYGDLTMRTPECSLVMALAVTHHLRVAANVPFAMQLEWFASLGPRLLIEFVSPEDGMARRLLERRSSPYPDYTKSAFEAEVATRFHTIDTVMLTPTRHLYNLTRRSVRADR